MTNAEFMEKYSNSSDEINYYVNKLQDAIDGIAGDEVNSHGLLPNIKAWHKNKMPLINILRKHPKWNEEAKSVVIPTSISRVADLNHAKVLYKELVCFVDRNAPMEGDLINAFFNFSNLLKCNADTEIIEFWQKVDPTIKIHEGQKITRVINGLFKNITLLNGNQMDATTIANDTNSYNKLFAKLADSLSPLEVKRTTVLSANPVDYLLMSNGNSWNSCHNIEDGCYRAGTLSYMNDEVSLILYTVPENSGEQERLCTIPKVERQVFCYSGGLLIQSRLYPRDDTQIGDKLRIIVQQIFAECLSVPNLWTLKRESVGNYCITDGTQYPDYQYRQATSSASLHKELYTAGDDGKIHIGAKQYCVTCGDVFSYEDSLSCCGTSYRCKNCGERLDEDDLHWVESEDGYYCDDCCFYCDYHDEYEVGDSYGVGDMYVCEYVFNHEVIECDHCGRNTWKDEAVESSSGKCYCERCADRYLYQCSDCGDYLEGDDVFDINGNYYCECCVERNFVRCDECEEWIERGDEQNLDGKVLCSGCYDEAVEAKETESVPERLGV